MLSRLPKRQRTPLHARRGLGHWVRETMKFVQTQPGAWLTLMGKKAALLWNRTEFVDTESQGATKSSSPLLQALAHVGHFSILVPLAVLGIFATWNDRSRVGVYYAMAAAYALSVVIFYVSARYRLPLVPFLMLFAFAGLSSLTSFVRASRGRKSLLPLLLIGAVAVSRTGRFCRQKSCEPPGNESRCSAPDR